MRRPLTRPALWAALCCAALFAWSTATAAPAPLPRPPREQIRQHHASLVGTWTLYWHGAKGTVMLAADGGYTCRWCGLDFVGHWKFCDGCVVITESYRPHDENSWHVYSVKLEPDRSSGRPAPVRLERAR